MIVVATITDGVIHDSTAFVGENGIIMRGVFAGSKIKDIAERHFVTQCRERDPKLSDEDLEAILDDGYFEFHNGSICIFEPDIA